MDLFTEADIIYSYTRRQAIEDGEQVDLCGAFVGQMAARAAAVQEAGFTVPVFLTRRVWDTCVEVPENKEDTQDEIGRLWDVLYVLRSAIRRAGNTDRIPYRISVVTAKGRRAMDLLAVCAAKDIDDPAPSITIMFDDED